MKIYIVILSLFFPIILLANSSFFVKNEGQLLNQNNDEINQVLYFYNGKDFDVYFQKDKISYVIKKVTNNNNPIDSILNCNQTYQILSYRVDMEFELSNHNKIIQGFSPFQINHHYIANKGIINIKNGYEELVYENIYDGIDLRFYFYNNSLKYDFVVHPKGNYKAIKMNYFGVNEISNKHISISLSTPLGDIEEKIPLIYQISNHDKKVKSGRFEIENNQVSFLIENVELDKTLVIDPWVTFIGGADIEESYGVYGDNKFNTYVAGNTASINFPTTPGVLQTVKQGFYDAFLTKLDTAGKAIWSTFYGGSADEFGYDVVVDDDENPYLVGYTNSNDIVVSGSGVFQSSSNGSYDSFILKLDSAGNFIWGTYYGGSGGEFTLAADIDNSNNLVIGGFTSSTDMPLMNSFQNTNGGALDAFVAKFDSTGNLMWSTYCGGSNSEDVHALKVDHQNNIIITGETFSSDFPTSIGAYQTNNNGNLDVFVAKYDSLGIRQFATYFGGSNAEDGLGVGVDNDDNIYVAGYSKSIDFPIIGSNVYQATKNTGDDATVVKFSPSGIPVKSTFIGGTANERFTAVSLGNSGALYLGGYSNSTDFPILGTSYQMNNNGLTDGIYVKLDSSLTPNYTTYFGGSNEDFVYDLFTDINETLSFCGHTSSINFPVTANVFQDTLGGQFDAFVFHTDSVFDVINGVSFIKDVYSNLSIFPNPFDNHIQINIDGFNLKMEYVFKLYGIDGKEILTQKLRHNNEIISIDSNLKPGNYLLVVFKDEQPFAAKKLIKKE